jgi:translation initiation factor 1
MPRPSRTHVDECPVSRWPNSKCICPPPQAVAPPSDGVVRVGRETKGRKGKGVTLITGVPMIGKELNQLAKALKKKCGTGGTVRDGVIEIQGDHRDLLVTELQKHGWTVKKSGG